MGLLQNTKSQQDIDDCLLDHTNILYEKHFAAASIFKGMRHVYEEQGKR